MQRCVTSLINDMDGADGARPLSPLTTHENIRGSAYTLEEALILEYQTTVKLLACAFLLWLRNTVDNSKYRIYLSCLLRNGH